ncbi:hypothetical protein [Clostridium botulinum]|uniref:hypothetical protein n=1 Tax=Clostridium botulinum TaxID=1491 RepID=UPI0004B15A48|nr:hypothetical protein [Clostridium botulinum]QDY27296.1 hypothetical protein CGQ40_21545 [Clostridium botulinum]
MEEQWTPNKIKVGDRVKVRFNNDAVGRSKFREIKGRVLSITSSFILIKTKTFKECFLINDIRCNRVKIEVLKKCT